MNAGNYNTGIPLASPFGYAEPVEAHPPKISGAGTVTRSRLAEHWRIDPDTVAAIARRERLNDCAPKGPPLFRWSEVWALEGAGLVPETLWDAYRAPLLTPDEVARLLSRSERTIRDYLAQRVIPCVALGPRIRRVRQLDLEKVLG